MAEEFAYKIIIVGDSGVGKSNLATRFCDDLFFADGTATLGMDFKYTRCTIGAASSSSSSTSSSEAPTRSVRLQIWDASGHDRFMAMTQTFYRSCNGVLMCFDLTNRHSFERLDRWYQHLIQYNDPQDMVPLIIVGCKLDLVARHASAAEIVGSMLQPSNRASQGGGGNMLMPTEAQPTRLRQVESQEAVEWAMKHHALSYIETSAKDSINIDAVFQQLTLEMVARAGDAAISDPPTAPQRNTSLGRARTAKDTVETKKSRSTCC